MARSRSIIVEEPHPKRRRSGRIGNLATLAANVTHTVHQIISEGRIFHLQRPIDLSVRHRGPYCFIEYEPLNITGYGRDEREALEAFAADFSATWDWIAAARDSQLGGEARELKGELRELVASVEAA